MYENYLTPCVYVEPAACMAGKVPLIPLFLAGNSTPTILHKYSQHKTIHQKNRDSITLPLLFVQALDDDAEVHAS